LLLLMLGSELLLLYRQLLSVHLVRSSLGQLLLLHL
jgi:hypothetical protein